MTIDEAKQILGPEALTMSDGEIANEIQAIRSLVKVFWKQYQENLTHVEGFNHNGVRN